MDEKPDEVIDTEEDKKYKTFLLDGFQIRTAETALDNFKEKLVTQTDTERKMRAWVQGKMRLRDAKKPVDIGMFDKATDRFLAYIFKEQLREAHKQRKLTDGFSTMTISGIDTKEKADAVAKVVMDSMEQKAKEMHYRKIGKPLPLMAAARCQKCHGPHKAGATHKFEPAARGRGRPKKGK